MVRLSRPQLMIAISLALAACTLPWGNPPVASAAEGPNLVANGSFENGKTGWKVNGGGATQFSVVDGGMNSAQAAQLTSATRRNLTLNDQVNSAQDVPIGTQFQLSAWVRATRGVNVELRVREVADGGVTVHGTRVAIAEGQWQLLEVRFLTNRDGASLDVNVIAWNASAGTRLTIDDIALRSVTDDADDNPSVPPVGDGLHLTNDCSVSQRGIPSCGAYFGAATGSNGDPASFETEAGQQFGVRRTYWQGGQVDAAVRTAAEDVAAKRIPWISFKLPYSWRDMAQGRGDSWARNLASRLSQLDGPVWVAFHHEPELDGNIAEWTALQERLAPLVRSTAPNVAFTIIVTGWHQTRGNTRDYGLDVLWPQETKVDVIGFDTYNYFGTPGSNRNTPADLREDYFKFLSTWASDHDIAWAIGELGYTDATAAADSAWLRRTYNDLVDLGGVALSYFNSSLNASGDWLLDSTVRRRQFIDVLRGSPVLQ